MQRLRAERAVQLGGVAEGTARSVAKRSTLHEYAAKTGAGRDHVEALSTALAAFGSGALTNEKAYLLGKFARLALRTPHIDYNGR